MSHFIQEGPVLENQYESDRMLISYLNRVLPDDIFPEIETDLKNLGNRVISDIFEVAKDAEANEPKLINYDTWGKRIDEIRVSKSWNKLDSISAEEGMVAIGYERKYSEFSRVYQFAKLYLFNPSSAIYTCPLAMTDGGAKLTEVYGDDDLKNTVYKHITSRDPEYFWTSGQWMTERTGGSDVGTSETVARFENGEYRLYGAKWFVSAATSQSAFTLARIENEEGNTTPGSRGLSLFFLELKDKNGNLNNFTIDGLKDKLGTRSLPTAELTLNGTRAKLVGSPGGGVKKIATLFNITRIYNAVTSVAFMRRGIALAHDYSKRRKAFGKIISEQPLHIETLANMEIEFEAAFHAVFYTVSLLGKEECGKASEEEKAVLRLLTPLIKLYTARQCINVITEVIEVFGGVGYVEDSGLPTLLRDAHVLSIWEGTTNILSLDALRAIEKEKALFPFLKNIQNRLEIINHPELSDAKNKVYQAVSNIKEYVSLALKHDSDFIQAGARNFAFGLIRTFAASLMLEHAEWSLNQNEKYFKITALRWCEQYLTPFIYPDKGYRSDSKLVIFE